MLLQFVFLKSVLLVSSYAYLSCIQLVFWNVFLSLWPFLIWGCLEQWFIHSEYKSFVIYRHYKYFIFQVLIFSDSFGETFWWYLMYHFLFVILIPKKIFAYLKVGIYFPIVYSRDFVLSVWFLINFYDLM